MSLISKDESHCLTQRRTENSPLFESYLGQAQIQCLQKRLETQRTEFCRAEWPHSSAGFTQSMLTEYVKISRTQDLGF